MSEERLAKLEKRRKANRIILKIFGNIREKQNLSCSIVTVGEERMETKEDLTLERYDPSRARTNSEREEEMKITDVNWSFFANSKSYVVSVRCAACPRKF